MGITVLAESVVPSDLKIMDCPGLRRLGKVDLRLHHDRDRMTDASETFLDFVHQRLKMVS